MPQQEAEHCSFKYGFPLDSYFCRRTSSAGIAFHAWHDISPDCRFPNPHPHPDAGLKAPQK
jgi:hypothetical protein